MSGGGHGGGGHGGHGGHGGGGHHSGNPSSHHTAQPAHTHHHPSGQAHPHRQDIPLAIRLDAWWSLRLDAWWGLSLGFIVSLLVLGLGALTILAGHPWTGGGSLSADVVALAGVFVIAQYRQSKERVEKDAQSRQPGIPGSPARRD